MSIEMTNRSTIEELPNKSKTKCVEKSTSTRDERIEIDLLEIILIIIHEKEGRL